MAGLALHRYPAGRLLALYRSGDVTPVDAAQAYLSRIEQLDGQLGSFVTVDRRSTLAAAAESATRYRNKTDRRLEGLPIAIKDLVDTAGLRTTYGSRMFEGHVPERDAAVVAAFRAAGAVVLGKTATHEFAWGITTDGRAYGPTRNPWDPRRTAGGSSGGSAAAVAAGLAPVAVGTDTVGSVRIPAAFCGVPGFKPTFGRLDRTGAFPLAKSLDHLGLMARNVADVALMWDVLHPERDTGSDRPVDTVRFGVMTPAVPGPARVALRRLSRRLSEVGAPSHALTITGHDDALAVAGAIVGFEGLRVHRAYGLWPGRRAEYEPDVAARLAGATLIGEQQYTEAQRRRTELREATSSALDQVDVIAMPVSLAQPLTAVELRDAQVVNRFRRDVMSQTALANLTGYPAVTVPVGLDHNGQPLGIQLMAAPGCDRMLLRVAQYLFPGNADSPPEPGGS